MVNVFYRSAKSKMDQNTVSYVLPNLGIADHDRSLKQQLTALVRHVEQALEPDYISQIKDRVMREQRIDEQEWENRFFEWKRICLLTFICKGLPLYSREVHEIWLEASSFTDQLEELSQKWIGQRQFPVPRLPKDDEFNQNERAWFDLIYSLIFEKTQFSQRTFGHFYQYPLPKEVTNDFFTMTTAQLAEKYFQNKWNSHIPMLEGIIQAMIVYIQKQLQTYEHAQFEQLIQIASKKGSNHESFVRFLYLSAYEYDQYDQRKSSWIEASPKSFKDETTQLHDERNSEVH